MTKFNHADKVTCTMNYGPGCEITDAKISINDDGTHYMCHNHFAFDWAKADDMLGYPYCLQLSSNFTNDYIDELRIAAPRKVRDADVGDLVVNGTYTRMVIDSFPNSVLLSYDDDHRRASSPYSRDQLEEDFTLVEPTPTPPPEEMTLAEVCTALGKDIIIKE